MERQVRSHMALFLFAQILLGMTIILVLIFRLFALNQNPNDHDPVTLTISMLLITYLTVCDRATTLWMLRRKIKRGSSSSSSSTRILRKSL